MPGVGRERRRHGGRAGERPMTPRVRRRDLLTLLVHCGAGALLLGVLAASGLFFPPTMWATVGGSVLGAWVGLATYRLRSDSFI